MLKIRVPATSANLGSGFDCLGLALTLYNTVKVQTTAHDKLEISIRGEGAESLPRNSDNLVFRAIELIFKRKGKPLPGLRIWQHNRIRLNSGLGSSASAVVAGLVAGNELLGCPFSRQELATLGFQLEQHADNVAAALCGGLAIACLQDGQVHCHSVSPPPDLRAIICLPELQVETLASRRRLRRTVPLQDAVFNISRASLLVASLLTDQFEHLRIAMEDKLHQDQRMAFLPGARQACEAALEAGALGAALSGSGPSILALAKRDFGKVESAMVEAFRGAGVECKTMRLKADTEGATILCNKKSVESVL